MAWTWQGGDRGPGCEPGREGHVMSLAAVVGELWRCTTKNPPGLSQRSKVLERALGSLDQQQTRLSLGTSAAARPTRPPHGHLAPGSSQPSSPPVTGAGWVGSMCPHPRALTHTRPRLRPHRAPNMATRGRRYIAFCHPMWAHGPGPAGHGSCLGVTCVDRPLWFSLADLPGSESHGPQCSYRAARSLHLRSTC